TLGGTVTAGDTWTVTIDGTDYDYLAVSGNTLSSVAQGLAGQIDPMVGLAAGADGGTLVVTKTGGGRFNLAATLPADATAPIADSGKEIVESSITDTTGPTAAEITIDSVRVPGTTTAADWTVTLDTAVAPTKVTATIYRYKVNVNPGTSSLSRVVVEYRFVDG